MGAVGVDPALRAVSWKLLLRHYGFKQSRDERAMRDTQVDMSYLALNREYKLVSHFGSNCGHSYHVSTHASYRR